MTVARVPGTVAQLEIQSIAAGGDGVGRADGLVVFVPRTAPGDRALVRIKQANRFARGELDALLQPSSLRVSPPCTHYRVDRCGGCQLQHIRYESQLEAKSAIVLDALQRIGKRAIEPPAVQPSERQWRYRRKLTLAMCRMTSGWRMGLRPYDDPSQLFQLEDCPITDERVVATWREIMRAEQSLPQDSELRGSVRLGAGGSTVIIEGGRDWRTSDRFFAAVPSAAVLWWKPERAARRLIAQRPGVDASATASFGQVNAEAAAALCGDRRDGGVVGRVRSARHCHRAGSRRRRALRGATAQRVARDCGTGRGSPRADASRGCGAAQSAPRGSRRTCSGYPHSSGTSPARDLLRELRPSNARARPHATCGLPDCLGCLLRHVSSDRARRDGVRVGAGSTVKYVVRSHGREMEIDVDADGVRIDGESVPARLAEVEGTPERVLTVGEAIHRVIVRRGVNRGDYTLWVDGYRFDVEALDERTRAIRELAAASTGPGGPAPLKSPMPGMIVRVNVAAGDAVQVGQGLVVIEAMKMENELRATGAGNVKRVHVTAGTAVEKGALLVEME